MIAKQIVILFTVSMLVSGCTTTSSQTPSPSPTPSPAPTATVAALPDLVIYNVAYEVIPSGCYRNESHSVLRVVVGNNGKGDAPTFTVTVDGIDQVVAQGLKARNEISVDFSESKGYLHDVYIDKANAIQESDKSNNSRLQVQLPVLTQAPKCTETPMGATLAATQASS
jgi:hypothetical protein